MACRSRPSNCPGRRGRRPGSPAGRKPRLPHLRQRTRPDRPPVVPVVRRPRAGGALSAGRHPGSLPVGAGRPAGGHRTLGGRRRARAGRERVREIQRHGALAGAAARAAVPQRLDQMRADAQVAVAGLAPGEPVVGDRPAPGGCRRCPGRGGRPCRPRPGPSGRARPPHRRLARRLGRPGPARPGRDRTPGLDRGRDPRRPRPRDRPGQAAERLRDELRNHVQDSPGFRAPPGDQGPGQPAGSSTRPRTATGAPQCPRPRRRAQRGPGTAPGRWVVSGPTRRRYRSAAPPGRCPAGRPRPIPHGAPCGRSTGPTGWSCRIQGCHDADNRHRRGEQPINQRGTGHDP